MELTQAPIGVTAMRSMAASGLATTRALLQKTNNGKMLSADSAANKDSPLPPYIRIVILLGVVIGGLVLSVSVIMFCSHCLKKIKQLKRKVTERTDVPERGQYKSLIVRSESSRQYEPSAFVHLIQTNAVIVSRPDDVVKQTTLVASEEEEEDGKVENEEKERHRSLGLDDEIDHAFAIYREQVPALEPGVHPSPVIHPHPPKSPPTSSDAELDENDVTKKKREKEDDDDEEEEEEGESPSPKQFAFLPIDRVINHRRHVSFELEKFSSSGGIDYQPLKHEDNSNSGDGWSHRPRGPTGFKQVSFDAGRHSQSASSVGPTSQRKTGRPACLSPAAPLRPKLRERCMTMDPKLQRVRDKSFEVKVDVHRTQATAGGGGVGKGGGVYPSGAGRSGGACRNMWLSVALENRRFVDEQRPYWNSLELGQDRKLEGNVTRLVNSYDEQIIVPSRLITYDPLRITEFLNGPSGDDEFGFRAELRGHYLPKRVKVFDTGVSFDQTDLEERRSSRNGGDMELGAAAAAVRRDSVVSRRDSLTACPRRDSLPAENATLVRQQTWGKRTFRGIAMSRTIDIPDRTARKDTPPDNHLPQRQGGPPCEPTNDLPTNASSTAVEGAKDQPTAVRRQMYGTAFSNRSRRSADGNSFDSVATDVDASESSHCEVTTTSIESSTTTVSTDSTGDARSSHKLHQMRDDSGYKSLETQQSLAKTGTQSLDVQAMPCRKIAGQSLDSQVYMPPRVLVGGRSPEQIRASVKAGARRQEQCPPTMHRATAAEGGKGKERLTTVDDDENAESSKWRPKEPWKKAGAASMESSPQGSLQNKNFLEVPNADRGFRLPLTKARSQDFVGREQTEDGASGSSTVPSSASSIFPLSLERLWHRAELYLSSAVTQAETLLGRGNSRDSEPPGSPPPLEEVQVVPNPTEEGCSAGKPNLGNGSSFCQSPELEDTKCAERGQDHGTASSISPLSNPPMTYRVSDTVIRPVWSQLIAEKEALALQEKQAREIGGAGIVLHTKVGAIRRGDLKTASKKRREYRSRKQLTEVSDSTLESLSSSDRLFGHAGFSSAAHEDGSEPVMTADPLRRSLTTRDYSMDEKTYSIFNDFIQYDPKFDSSSGPRHTATTTAAAEPCSEIGSSHQHPIVLRPKRKQLDPVPEVKRPFKGPHPTIRGVSLDVEMTGPSRSTKFDYDSIAEETPVPDGES